MATATTTEAPQRVRAQARYLRTLRAKARIVLEHIRGKSYSEARATLTFLPRAAARDILKIARVGRRQCRAQPGLRRTSS